MEENKTEMFGVSINALDIMPLENYVHQIKNKKFIDITKTAFDSNCHGTAIKENDIIFMFLLDTDRNMFYNKVSSIVNCKLLEKPIMVERTMPSIKA